MRYLVRIAIMFALVFTTTLLPSNSLAQDSKETGTITGRVQLGGKPAQGVIVVATPIGSIPNPSNTMEEVFKPPVPSKAVTDSDGRFRFEGLSPGKYAVATFAPALVSLDSEAHKSVTVSEGTTTEDINFSLSRGGVITGKVTDSDGRPIIAEQISLKVVDSAKPGTGYEGMWDRMYFTDDRGIYRIFGLAPGHYIVSSGDTSGAISGLLNRPNNATKTFYPGVTDESKSKAVEVLAGAEASGIDIKLGLADKGFSAKGRVFIAETGAPISNAVVLYSPITSTEDTESDSNDSRAVTARQASAPGRAPGITTTDARGEFRFESLTAGRYNIEVRPMTPLTGSSEFYCDPVNFEVRSANIEKIEVKAHLGASLSGVVSVEGAGVSTNPRDAPLVMLTAISNSEEPSAGICRLSADGSFHMGGLRAGTFKIGAANYSARNYALVRVERNGVPQPDGIDVQSNEQVTGVRVIVVEARGVINGRVTLQGGTLSRDSEISIWVRALNEFNESQRSVVDANGGFVIEDLAPGDYEVECSVVLPGSDAEDSRRRTGKQMVTVTNGVAAQVSLVLDLSGKRFDK